MEIAAAPPRLRERSSDTKPKSGRFAVMSLTGQKRRFGLVPVTSGLPRQADVFGGGDMSQTCHLRTLAALRSHAPKQPILLWEM